ncbi:hypothetical protein MMYC01_207520 [Madurella mycetomatis]|uniref:Nucleoside phosphorylase domain-containing protein n=1 Tax=Madurella mycetomatis TaxID=100816 RepID=A0A175W1P6_9PEZI|nr:hypothetical protein MMYC01_207520 [Madurella mycetomatis]
MPEYSFSERPQKRLRSSETTGWQEPTKSYDGPPTTDSFATSAQGIQQRTHPGTPPHRDTLPSGRPTAKITTGIVLESPNLYTIGWIAALGIKRAAVITLLDERHDEPRGFSQHPSDVNSYAWGRMGKHNIVIASPVAGVYGTTSAATTASSLLYSMPEIKIGLLPDGATGGVVQYGLAKAKSNNERERKVFLNKPPSVRLHVLSAMQADYFISGSKVPSLLEEMWTTYPQMVKSTKTIPEFAQGPENDRLSHASCQHVDGSDCPKGDQNEEVHRDARDSMDPEVHYGVIASRNTLVKDATTRDELADYFGQDCLCVEMEAAGLMNHFLCIRYASATAAAFGKELLDYVPVKNLQEKRRAAEFLQSNALDECISTPELFKWKETLSSSELKNVRLIATSRREEELESGLRWIGKESMIDMDRSVVNEDIRFYTKARLQSSTEFQKRWGSRLEVLEEIESVIGRNLIECSDGLHVNLISLTNAWTTMNYRTPFALYHDI